MEKQSLYNLYLEAIKNNSSRLDRFDNFLKSVRKHYAEELLELSSNTVNNPKFRKTYQGKLKNLKISGVDEYMGSYYYESLYWMALCFDKYFVLDYQRNSFSWNQKRNYKKQLDNMEVFARTPLGGMFAKDLLKVQNALNHYISNSKIGFANEIEFKTHVELCAYLISKKYFDNKFGFIQITLKLLNLFVPSIDSNESSLKRKLNRKKTSKSESFIDLEEKISIF